MKKFYFKLSGDIITDAIDYPHAGYTEVELDETHLPSGINAGYYRLQNGVYAVDDILYSESIGVITANAKEEGREEIRTIVRGAALMNTIGFEAKTELKNKGVLPANA